MKKTLALVLALVMVLALVPTAFAYQYVNTNNYKVVATIDPVGSLTQINDPSFTWTPEVTGSSNNMTLKINVPFKQIATQASTDIWSNNGDLKVSLELRNLGTSSKYFSVGDTLDWTKIDKIYVNGYESVQGDSKVTFPSGTNGIQFNMGGISSLSNTYRYTVKIVGKPSASGADDYAVEEVTFDVKFNNTDKSAESLQVVAIEGGVKKDGIWYFDSDSAYLASLNSQDITLAKAGGGSFGETAYYTIAAGENYAAFPSTNSSLNALKDSKIKDFDLSNLLADSSADTKYKIAICVETQYQQYKTVIDVKFRTNVSAVDPKGVNFARDEYTIAVNEVLFPTYTYIIDPLKDLAADISLTQTAYGEKNIIDIDKNRADGKDAIIGLKEGTAYVKLEYTYPATGSVPAKLYTDTAKVTVKNTVAIQPNGNYVVRTATGSCLNKRAAASTSSRNIGKLANGSVVQVIEITNGWAKCLDSSSSYSNYYVSSAYLVPQTTGTPATNVTTSGTGVVIARSLNVRVGAGTSYAIVGTLRRNAKVSIVETVANGSWAKIKYNNGTAYVSMKYIA